MPDTRQSLNLANILTLARLACLPVVMVLLRQGRGAAAAAVFLAAMLTDCVDGWVARRMRCETPLGLYLDPVVDKILILGLLYELALAGALPAVLAHLFLARELLQNAVRAAAARRGKVVGANWMGKVKAALQTVLVTWGLLLPAFAARLSAPASNRMAAAFCGAAVLVAVLAWVFFGVFAFRNRRLIV